MLDFGQWSNYCVCCLMSTERKTVCRICKVKLCYVRTEVTRKMVTIGSTRWRVWNDGWWDRGSVMWHLIGTAGVLFHNQPWHNLLATVKILLVLPNREFPQKQHYLREFLCRIVPDFQAIGHWKLLIRIYLWWPLHNLISNYSSCSSVVCNSNFANIIVV